MKLFGVQLTKVLQDLARIETSIFKNFSKLVKMLQS